MDYTKLMNDTAGQVSALGVVGATGGYGYTLLAQIIHVKHLRLRAVSALDTDECRAVLAEIGYDAARLHVCATLEDIAAAPEDAVLIVTRYRDIADCGITSLVECTGDTAVSVDIAVRCLTRGINVYMCSKEADSVCGPMLNQIAARHHAVYALVNGDQPRNLIDLCSWARLLGLEIICAGKASEYDFVWDRETAVLSYTDGSGSTAHTPAMKDCWQYTGTETLAMRRRLVDRWAGVIPADLCEMNLVANITGFAPAAPFLNYPVAKTSELADIFIPKEDGGILERTGVVDVFYHLRGTDEASFAGGEFIIVKCKNKKMWDMLAAKGHVVSRNGAYCCIYSPYHFMGMETPASILLGDHMGIGTHPETRHAVVMAGTAARDLPAGTELSVRGHHHAIDGLIPQLLTRECAETAAPFYLLNGAKLLRDIKKGRPVTTDDVDLSRLDTYRLFTEGLALDEQSRQ